MKHDKANTNTGNGNAIRRVNDNSTIDVFNQTQSTVNAQVPATIDQQKLDINMFRQTVQRKREVAIERNTSQRAYTGRSNEVMKQHNVVQDDVTRAMANPFHDIVAFFNDEKSTDQLLNEQKGLAMQLHTINKNNQSATAMFDEQINVLNDGLSDQLGLSQLKATQSAEIANLIDRQTKVETARKDYEDNIMEGKTLKSLQLELNDSTSKLSRGRLVKWIQIKQGESLDLANKRKAAKNGGKIPTKSEVLGYTSTDVLLGQLQAMAVRGVGSTVIDGQQMTSEDIQVQIDKNRTNSSKSANSIDILNNSMALASTMPNRIQQAVDRLNPETLPVQNQSELLAANGLAKVFQEAQNQLAKARKEGKNIDAQTFTRFNMLARTTSDMGDRALSNAAEVRSQRFTNEVARKSAKSFYETGVMESGTDARQIMTELVLTEDPNALASEAGNVFGPVVVQFAEQFSASMTENFSDPSVRFLDEDGEEISGFSGERLNFQLAESNKVNKLNSTVAWRRVLAASSGAKPGSGEEANKWKSLIANQMLTPQLLLSTQEFVMLPEVQSNQQLRDLLTTSGGQLKSEFLSAEVDSVSLILQKIATMSQQQKIAGKLGEDVNYGQMFLDVMGSEAIINVAKSEFEQQDIVLQSMLRGLYGTGKAAGSYINSYVDKLHSYDPKAFEAQIKETVIEHKKNKESSDKILINSNIGRAL